MHKLENLIIWQKAMDLAVEVYTLSKGLPVEERYGLTSQMRRSAISIPSNIAEGAGRHTQKDFARFLSISNGSSYELQSQTILAYRSEMLDKDLCIPILDTLDELQKMNYAFQNNLRNGN